MQFSAPFAPLGAAIWRNNEDMRLRLTILIIFVLSFAITLRGQSRMGYDGKDLGRIGQWLAFYHLELYRLEIPTYASPYSVLLTSGHKGWRIVVFLRDGGLVNVDWDSGFLPRSFQLSSTDALVLLPKAGNNFGVTFSGCDARNCGQNYGALLYLPWSHRFFEKVIGKNSVSCSQSLLDPQNAFAVQALNDALRRQHPTDAFQAVPKCRQGE